MTHGSLFSGIGGFDLAAEWMGWENKFHCEWNEFGQKVLHYYWPEAELFTDITKSNFTKYANTIDVLSGGFPCQPYSSAGKRLGKEDERHLWPEMLRAIREIQPSWVVGENVRGLTNWNGGMVFDEVQAELEAEGYEVTPFLLPACAVNAPHRRDRIWFVAYSESNGRNGGKCKQREGVEINQREFCEHKTEGRDEIWTESERHSKNGFVAYSESNGSTISKLGESESRQQIQTRSNINGFEGLGDATNPNRNGLNECNGNNEVNTSERGFNAFGDINESNGDGDVADTDSKRLERQYRKWQRCTEYRENTGLFIGAKNKFIRKNWKQFPTVSPICNGDDGISDRLDNITFPKWRNESIKAGGNAIVPQVVHQIFKAIEHYERSRTPNKD